MAENIVTNNDSLYLYFMSLANKSFKREKKLYNIYNRKIKNIKNNKYSPINSIDKLDSTTCSNMYEIFSGVSNDIMTLLRDRRLYYKIAGKSLDLGEDKGISLQKFQKVFLAEGKADHKNSFSQKVREIIVKNIEEEEQKKKDKTTISQSIAEQIVNLITKNKRVEAENIIKNETMDLTFSETTEGGFDFKIRKSGTGNLLWKQEDTIKLIKEIQQRYDLSIIKKSDYYIIQPQDNIENEEIINLFLQKLIDAIEDLSEKEINKEEIEKIKKAMYKVINESGETARELLINPKTENKIRGDIGEFLVGVFNQMGFEQTSTFVGDIQTSTGQAAVDIYIGKLGYQVKNFPASEGSNIIQLYSSVNQLTEDGRESRGLSKEQNKKLYENFYKIYYEKDNSQVDYLKNDIFKILKIALPKFMRYSQNFTQSELEKNSILKTLSKIENNIYIVNFRVIPASRIFYELARNIKDTEQGVKIENLFYEDFKEYGNVSNNKNLFNQILGRKTNFDLLYLYFKGIPINYSGLKVNSNEQSGNLLANTFKKVKL